MARSNGRTSGACNVRRRRLVLGSSLTIEYFSGCEPDDVEDFHVLQFEVFYGDATLTIVERCSVIDSSW